MASASLAAPPEHDGARSIDSTPPEKGLGCPPEGNHNRSAMVEGQARAPIVKKAAGSKAAAKSRKPLPGHRNSWADIDPSDTSCCSTDLLCSDDCSDLDPGCASEGSMEKVSAVKASAERASAGNTSESRMRGAGVEVNDPTEPVRLMARTWR